MKLLALETSTVTCSVSLLDSDAAEEPRLISRFESGARRQTALVLPMVDQILVESGYRLSQLDGIAFGQGPGAFTGVRVAVSVAQGLAYSADLPVCGISTLASMAQLVKENFHADHIITALDARMGELYLGVFDGSQALVTPLMPECVCHPDQLPALPEPVAHTGVRWLGAGSGGLYADQINAQYPLAGHWHEDIHPHADTVARLAVDAFRQGLQVSPGEAAPVYLRNNVAGGAVR